MGVIRPEGENRGAVRRRRECEKRVFMIPCAFEKAGHPCARVRQSGGCGVEIIIPAGDDTWRIMRRSCQFEGIRARGVAADCPDAILPCTGYVRLRGAASRRSSPRRTAGAFAASGALTVRSAELGPPQPHHPHQPHPKADSQNQFPLKNSLAPDGRRWSVGRAQLRARVRSFITRNRGAAFEHCARGFGGFSGRFCSKVVVLVHSNAIT
jgi:hypothetical protein